MLFLFVYSIWATWDEDHRPTWERDRIKKRNERMKGWVKAVVGDWDKDGER